MRFDFSDSLAEATLDFRHSLTLAHVSSLVKVLEVGAQFLQQFLGKSLSHRWLILHHGRCGGKITRNWSTRFIRNAEAARRIECRRYAMGSEVWPLIPWIGRGRCEEKPSQ